MMKKLGIENNLTKSIHLKKINIYAIVSNYPSLEKSRNFKIIMIYSTAKYTDVSVHSAITMIFNIQYIISLPKSKLHLNYL